MIVSRREIVAEARSWLGTRFAHRGHHKGIGADCIGLIYGVATRLDLNNGVVLPPYDRTPSKGLMFRMCEQHLVKRVGLEPGSIALLRFEFEPTHLAIFGDHPHYGLSLIHSFAKARKVVEHGFDDVWRGRLIAAYDYPGMSEH